MALLEQLFTVAAFTLVGGAVGYVTNVLAVRMLFRPVNPVCLIPRRLCVQGLLPRRRRELAERLARAVASRLQRGGLLQRYHERLQRALEKLVASMVSEQLSRGRAGQLLALIGGPQALEAIAAAVAAAAAPRLAALVEEAASRIDLEQLIVEEFLSLSVEEMERMFREAAGPELRFIELMGFALGAAIGLVEGILAALLL
ncbi:MAG: DUF445 family protein [Crenarchaeota archaeon]|nr:DUF445 family protein [Thermoproteota archaeon]